MPEQENELRLSPENQAVLNELLRMDTDVNEHTELKARPGEKIDQKFVKVVSAFLPALKKSINQVTLDVSLDPETIADLRKGYSIIKKVLDI